MRLITRIAVATLLLLVACAPSQQQQRLDETYDFTASQLKRVSHDLMASAAYQSAVEQGATPVDYVVAAMPEHGNYDPIVWKGPIAPWTVVIKEGPGQTELVVEAYGEATDKPTRSDTIDLRPAPRQG
jgi:hypothetical protein